MGRKLKEIDICEKCGKSQEDFPSRKAFLNHLQRKDHSISAEVLSA